jgi:hypothetical protein
MVAVLAVGVRRSAAVVEADGGVPGTDPAATTNRYRPNAAVPLPNTFVPSAYGGGDGKGGSRVGALAVETIRRSLATLNEGQVAGLAREDAEAVVSELQALEGRVAQIRDELRQLAEDA